MMMGGWGGRSVHHGLRNRPFSLSLFFLFFFSVQQYSVKDILWWFLASPPGIQSHILIYSWFCLIRLTIICSFIHTPLPPPSSLYYLRHTSPLLHPSFSAPFRRKLDSHPFRQWHIAAVCHHIPSTQHVPANSPPARLPLHLFVSFYSSIQRAPSGVDHLHLLYSWCSLLLVCIISSVFLTLGI